jgi:hypothetical protein
MEAALLLQKKKLPLHKNLSSGTFIHSSWEWKVVQPLRKTVWRLLKKLNIDLPYDPTIPLLGIYPKEHDWGYSRDTCTPMFIAALFTIAKLGKQPRCCTTEEWIKKMWYLCIMEFYSAMKKNKILWFTRNGWNSRTLSWAKLARLRRPKVICSVLYSDFRPMANILMWLDLGHMIRGEHIWEVCGYVRNTKLESIWCPYCRGNNTVTLKWQRSIWEGDWELVKRSGRDESVRVVIHLCMETILGISLYSYPYLN